MRWNTMFMTVVCVILLIKLEWPEDKSLHDIECHFVIYNNL